MRRLSWQAATVRINSIPRPSELEVPVFALLTYDVQMQSAVPAR